MCVCVYHFLSPCPVTAAISLQILHHVRPQKYPTSGRALEVTHALHRSIVDSRRLHLWTKLHAYPDARGEPSFAYESHGTGSSRGTLQQHLVCVCVWGGGLIFSFFHVSVVKLLTTCLR